MGKICVIKSCPSGRKKKNQINVPQSLSFFQARTPARLEKWRKSLGINFKATDYVCQLHFKEEHIKMYEKFIINGEVKLFPTGKKMLKEEAFPTVEHQFSPHPLSESINIKQTSVIDVIQHQINPKLCKNLLPENKRTQLESEKPQPTQQLQNDSNGHLETEVITQTIDNFRNNIKSTSILPPFWFYVEKPNQIEFMRIGLPTKQIKNHITLNEDLSVTVIFSNNDKFNLNEKIVSLNDLNNFLKSVEKWPLCVGTQMNNNKYSKLCKGVIIGADSYKRNQQNPRCKSCRILRNRLQYRNSSSTILDKKIAQKRCIENLKKQCKRLKKTKIRLREKISMMKSERAKKSEAVAKEAKNKSSSDHPNIVILCIDT